MIPMSTESVLYPLTALKYGYMRKSYHKPHTLRKFLVLNYFGVYMMVPKQQSLL